MDSKHNSTDSDKWVQWIEDGISKCYINYYEYKEFQNIRRIGSGAFSNVYRANWESSNTVIALKSFRTDSCIIEIVNELQLLHLTQFHANIIRFFGITKRKCNDNEDDLNPDYLLILEYADSEILNGKRETPTSDTPIDYIKIYNECWQDNPDNRPDMQQVFSELKLINLNIIGETKTLSEINDDFTIDDSDNFGINGISNSLSSNSLTSSGITNITLQAKIDKLMEEYDNMLTDKISITNDDDDDDDENCKKIIEELLFLHENSIQKEINIENYIQIVKQNIISNNKNEQFFINME
ncbi:unnamed protein product [Rhizophagus irregularis]|uniref:Protein kinase domain-containing protein n=1 Tax=Rhizophagus irregularis TaxID=588596 RepID=A0A915Z3M4_9GLOM|nr:unnamed protein product [Rhizophagus irregularis]CAB5359603.1 unnamed protein product [Rhizophagus irregularis]